ncbi:MAG: hypothetical protein LBS55_06305 [Prevotellaceae bacterium]|jgi:hypothetical protein|nr:hypothetical protein [Prevotellaceae bacterium]
MKSLRKGAIYFNSEKMEESHRIGESRHWEWLRNHPDSLKWHLSLDENVESDRKFIEGVEKARLYLKYRRFLNEVFPSSKFNK